MRASVRLLLGRLRMVVQAAGRDAIEAADLTAAADEGAAATQGGATQRTGRQVYPGIWAQVIPAQHDPGNVELHLGGLVGEDRRSAGGVGPGQGLRTRQSIAGRVGHDLDEDFSGYDNLLHLFPNRSRSPGHEQPGNPIHGLPLSQTNATRQLQHLVDRRPIEALVSTKKMTRVNDCHE